jgi:hypothetical protein
MLLIIASQPNSHLLPWPPRQLQLRPQQQQWQRLQA